MTKSVLAKNYIIMAHKEPGQLQRLVKTLDDSASLFFIHIDLKSDIKPFTSLIHQDNVFFIEERVNCIWGDYSQVKATLNLLERALESQNKGPIIFLSGQDYPIKSKEDIDAYLSTHADYDFINYVLSPIDKNSKLFNDRVAKYKVNLSDRRGDYILLSPFGTSLKNWLKVLSALLLGKVKRAELLSKIINARECRFTEHHKGTNWWCFSTATAQKIFRYYQANRAYLEQYYQYTLCADEQFFHTILKELMHEDKSIKTLPNLHFIDWSRKNVPLPVSFQKEDLTLLLSQNENKLFARKFESALDTEILDLMDTHIK